MSRTSRHGLWPGARLTNFQRHQGLHGPGNLHREIRDELKAHRVPNGMELDSISAKQRVDAIKVDIGPSHADDSRVR
ncbi:MAG: hypothetical protein VB878_09325 [Pirellulaceae bacterium]